MSTTRYSSGDTGNHGVRDRVRWLAILLAGITLPMISVATAVAITPSAAFANGFGTTLGSNPGASGQCTWWAENEFHQFNGVYVDTLGPNNGNAMFWGENAQSHGWTITTQPQVNSIVVFQPGIDGAGSVGHVAWVSAVSGTNISVSEMDFPAAGVVSTRQNIAGVNTGTTAGLTNIVYITPGSTTPSPSSTPTTQAVHVADVTGNGRADLVAVNDNSTYVMLSTGTGFSAPQEWSNYPFYGTKGTYLADVTGNGRADLVAVNDNSTYVMLSTGTGFSAPQEWSNCPFYGTKGTYLADVTGNGRADLVAVNDNSTYVMLSTGTGFSAPQEWSNSPFYGTKGTYLADVTGNGRADLVAVNDNSTYVMLSTGTGFSAPQEWSNTPFYGTKGTYLADVTGNGRADLVAVNDNSTYVMLSTGTGFSAPQEWSKLPVLRDQGHLPG